MSSNFFFLRFRVVLLGSALRTIRRFRMQIAARVLIQTQLQLLLVLLEFKSINCEVFCILYKNENIDVSAQLSY
jgi:hypothetical protein